MANGDTANVDTANVGTANVDTAGDTAGDAPGDTATVRVASWNVLADAYSCTPSTRGRYPDSPAGLLEPGARRSLVLDVVETLDAEVVCLQEAEAHLADAARARFGTAGAWWRPKRRGRPDGCLTIVRGPWQVVTEEVLEYRDAEPGDTAARRTGTVAQLLELDGPAGACLTVANTHLRWAEPHTPVASHIGVRQLRELLVHLAHRVPGGAVVVCADTNDEPGGPVRRRLDLAGFHSVGGDAVTSVHGALDVVAVRGARCGTARLPLTLDAAAPTGACPSDHVPVLAELAVPTRA